MKSKIFISFLALAVLLLPLGAFAQVNYADDGVVAYVTNSPNASGVLTLANFYNGYLVKTVGPS